MANTITMLVHVLMYLWDGGNLQCTSLIRCGVSCGACKFLRLRPCHCCGDAVRVESDGCQSCTLLVAWSCWHPPLHVGVSGCCGRILSLATRNKPASVRMLLPLFYACAMPETCPKFPRTIHMRVGRPRHDMISH